MVVALVTEPATRSDAPTPRTAALTAGYSYVVLFALAIFANFVVLEQVVEPGNAAATLQNLTDSEAMVRLAIAAFIVIFALDVVVAWALFYLFRPAGTAMSRLTAWFRLVYTVFLGVAVVSLFTALQLAGDDRHVESLGSEVRASHAMLAVDAFDAAWLIGLTCFGVHLALLGVMCRRSDVAPSPLGTVLVIAGAAYVFDTFAYSLLATYSDHDAVFGAIVAIPAVVAELALTVWLLGRAGRRSGTPAATRELPELVGV
jgi:hypothetical protein